MEIKANIIKHYLRNCLFINGTAYAGKSTMCKFLAEKYDLYHCEENYNGEVIFKTINAVDQPNLSYFNTKSSWEEYLNRTPQEYNDWVNGNSEELLGFEIAELIRVSQDKLVIVDTNIDIDILKEIADYHQVAFMVSPEEMAVDKFFDRPDPEKKFLRNQIDLCANPKETLHNFMEGIRVVHKANYNRFIDSGFFTLKREMEDKLTIEETADILAKHFKLV